ncbi:MAG TPA: hypothetical protein VK151_03310 [Fluviicola sp.]|nr:hypothetical protein [Fluviicola sp.]
MKRRTAFITGVAAAAITFGSLMATIGPRHFGRHCNSHAKHCSYEQDHQAHHNHHQAKHHNQNR